MKYLLLAPAVVLSALFVVWPMAEVISMSMMKQHILGNTWIGFGNYMALLSDHGFKQAMLNSVGYILLCVPLQVGGALAVTMAASGLSKRWQDFTRFVFYIPCMAAGMIIASVWEWIWHREGPVNWILGTQINFFGSTPLAVTAISITTASVGIGGMTIMLLASVLSIDKQLYDAAKIDGASDRQIKWRIIFPIILPTVWLIVLLSAIGAPQIIEYVLALAPYEHSATAAYDIYQTAFVMGRYGPASAKAVILLIWMMLMAWGKNRLTREA